MVNNFFLFFDGRDGSNGIDGADILLYPLSEFIYCAHSYVASRFVCPCYLFYLSACSV